MSILSFLLTAVLLVTLTEALVYRLPTNVLPTYYAIRLAPNIKLGHFIGYSEINITVAANDTKTIVLHAKNLKFNEAFTTLIDANNNNVKPVTQMVDNVTDFLTMNFSKTPLSAGRYVLNLQYSGSLNNEPKGLYRSSYINEKGEEMWLAATQFAPTHARDAFPCFDEPVMKAKFKISIDHFYNYSVISNMPVLNKVAVDEHSLQHRTTFQVTPLMSTYTVAFVISDLKSAISDDLRFTVWSRRSQIHKSKYALSVGQSALELLEDYTVFEHVIPKMDNVAIPQSQNNASNNWGLITYRENELFYEENVTTTSNKQNIAMVVARELTHQWFGNLVSPSWWDYTWLSQGFANYFQYYITDEVETNWRIMDQFVVENLQDKAFTADDTKIQHPLDWMVYSPADISRNFNAVTSNKAGSIIRMFSHALGKKVFRTGMKAYVKNKAYGAAGSEDLFAALANAKGAPSNVKPYFGSWVHQKGYPLLTVKRHANGNWMITQARYLPKKGTETPKEVWYMPLSWSFQDNPKFDDTAPNMWFSSPLSAWYNGPAPDKWIIFNKQQTGYYRVNYDETNWNLIINYLNTKDYAKIHVLNRAQLLDDSFQLAQSGYLDNHKKFLEISQHLRHEGDYIPWYPAFRGFEYLNKALMSTEQYPLFKLYMLKIMEKLETSVGYSEMVNDEHLSKLNRITVVDWACKMGSVNCTTSTLKMLIQHLEGTKKISTDLRDVVVCAGIRTANAAIWEQTFRFWKRSRDENERRAILKALGCSSDTKILKSYVRRTMDPSSGISLEFIIKAIIDGSERGVDIAIDFVKKNFATIVDMVADKETVLRCTNYIGNRITIEDQMEKLEKFINSLLAENKDLADILTATALARAISNIEWLEKYEATISSFLRNQELVEA